MFRSIKIFCIFFVIILCLCSCATKYDKGNSTYSSMNDSIDEQTSTQDQTSDSFEETANSEEETTLAQNENPVPIVGSFNRNVTNPYESFCYNGTVMENLTGVTVIGLNINTNYSKTLCSDVSISANTSITIDVNHGWGLAPGDVITFKADDYDDFVMKIPPMEPKAAWNEFLAQLDGTPNSGTLTTPNIGGGNSAAYYRSLVAEYQYKSEQAARDITYAQEQLDDAINNGVGSIIACQEMVRSATQLKQTYDDLVAKYQALADQAGY